MVRLVDPNEMELIYEKCKQVYLKEVSPKEACSQLKGRTNASESSLNMYFKIYECMRNGTCYKMGTSAAFTKFLIERISKEFGQEAMVTALSSAKQNSGYRISCDNEQPGIETVCRELIADYHLPVQYEELPEYKDNGIKRVSRKQQNKNTAKKNSKNKNAKNTNKSKNSIKIDISYGTIDFHAEGTPRTVIKELKVFSNKVLPQTLASLDNQNSEKATRKKKKGTTTNNTKAIKKQNQPNYIILKNKYPGIEELSQKMDFKARMIPLMFLSEESKLKSEFSIQDIQILLFEILGENAGKKEIEDVLTRRAEWFEKTNQAPRKYKLLDTARDYSRNILND